ncbi:hypothetical protein [Agrococcus sp. KRD186]|uniref:hypothetical protein n=1 Tax=Agrococcus sp. KRD186 TaxID=2729730 RepID=UPI0019D2439E|nr:hypothetical protein [Agrococcus sp. KRD186]
MTSEPRAYVVVTRVGEDWRDLPVPHVGVQLAHPSEPIALGWLAPLEPVKAGAELVAAAEATAEQLGLEVSSRWQLTDIGARAWLRRTA